MSRALLHFVVATTLSTGLAGMAAQAQAPGAEAYRTQPRAMPYAPLESNNALGFGHRLAPRDLVRAQAALDRGDFNRAVRLLDGRSPQANGPDGRYLSAVAHSGLGQYSRARTLFADALAQAPSHVGARVGLALTDLKLGRRERAAEGLALLEQRRRACAGDCADAVALDRATQVIRHFLEQAPAL